MKKLKPTVTKTPTHKLHQSVGKIILSVGANRAICNMNEFTAGYINHTPAQISEPWIQSYQAARLGHQISFRLIVPKITALGREFFQNIICNIKIRIDILHIIQIVQRFHHAQDFFSSFFIH